MSPLRDFLIGTQFLTRLPIPAALQGHWSMEDLRDSVYMFPLVGLLIGLTASLIYAAAVFLNLPPMLAAILTVAAQALITGALHEDGLADVADGFGGGRTRAQKLDIMRDSRLGTYGAIALMLGLSARIGAIAHLSDPALVAAGLIAAAALSRAALPVAMLHWPQARPDGLAASAGKPPPVRVYLGLGVGILVSFLSLSPTTAGIVIIACPVFAGLFLALSRRQIGGVTGDVLGGLQQILEIVCLVTVIALLSE